MARRRLKQFGIFVALTGTLLIAARLAYPWLEPARFVYSTHGIDVSHHQGAIDWRSIARDGVSFAYIKATEGGDFVDPRFQENWRGSGAADVERGAYHFFTQCRSGTTQAKNFIRTVPRTDSTLRHAVDAEHMGSCREGPRVADIVREIEIFLDLVEAHYGRRPIIYTTQEFHDEYLTNRLEGEKFWLRSLVAPPSFRSGDWVIWQYHNRGRRAGVSGPVDLNVLRAENLSDIR